MSGTDKTENLAWQANKSLAECNRFMLHHELACDVEFAVGVNGDIVRAHKYMLVSRSPVFLAMFYGSIGRTEHDDSPLRVPDTTVEAFRTMLQFIYCDDCSLSGENVLPVLYASKKYILPALSRLCAMFLEENLHVDNVSVVYEQCLYFDEMQILDKCRLFIETRTKEVFASETFKDLSHRTLENIVQFPSLSVNELTVFQACLAWSSKECLRRGFTISPENQRIVLGSILHHIRFPTMSLVEFAQDVSKTDVLTADDRCAVFEYIACRGDSCNYGENSDTKQAVSSPTDTPIDVDQLPRLRFPTSPRKYPLPLVLSRFTSFCKSGIYSGDCSMMRLRCDRQVYVRGFGVSGSMSCDPLHELTITIKQDRQFICNQSLSVSDDMTGEPIKVFLSDAVLLQPAVWYTVIITFQFHGEREQGSCRRGKGGTKSVRSEGILFEFDRCDSGSLIPEVLFAQAA